MKATIAKYMMYSTQHK